MKKLRLFGFVVFILLILFLLAKFYLPHFLSYKKPVDSKNFLIEAWISSYEIEQAVLDYGYDADSRFYIVGYQYPKLEPKWEKTINPDSTSERTNNQGVWLYANSSLGFVLPTELGLFQGNTIQIIVTAKGQETANQFAYFNLVINGKCIGGEFTQTDYLEYAFDWVLSEEGLKTCYIKFNNDLVVNNKDRNLNIKSVKIGNHLLIAEKNNTTLVRDLNNLTSGFTSQAEEIGNYIQQLGIDPKQITIVNFLPVQSNQTRAAAEKFSDFNSLSPLVAINVITSDIHSRRTWLTYHKIIGNQTNVGVLYYPTSGVGKVDVSKKHSELFYVIDEFLAYFVNWLLLIF